MLLQVTDISGTQTLDNNSLATDRFPRILLAYISNGIYKMENVDRNFAFKSSLCTESRRTYRYTSDPDIRGVS